MRHSRLLVAAVAVSLAASLTPRSRADHAAQIAELVQPLIDGKQVVGCIVGVIDGDVPEVHGFGTLRLETGEPMGAAPNGETIFEIGSVSKALTGTLMAEMIARGEVGLEQPMAELLPEGVTAPSFDGKPLTLLHLATQTSGLPRLPDNGWFLDITNPYVGYTPELMFEFLSHHKLRRAAGEYEYSNYGIGLLGTLLARRAGKGYEELVRERILDPLEMNDTRIALSPEQMARLAPGYNAARVAMKNWDFDAIAPAGAWRSSANDMLKLLAAALADDDRPVVKALHDAGVRRYGEDGKIGVGLCWHLARDGVTRWHNGQTGGYSSFVAYYPEKRAAVVVLCNTAVEETTLLGERILRAVLGVPEPEPVKRLEVEVELATLEKYVGTYQLMPAFAITVTLEEGKLFAQATGQAKYPLFAEGPTEFFYKVVEAQITFVAGDDGAVIGMVLHQNGANLSGKRVAEEKSGVD
jgi:CubicO group peptidase (beta-lactamase class C family)